MRFRRGRHFFIEMVTKCFFDTHQASILALFWSHFGGLGLVFGVKEWPEGGFGGVWKRGEKKGRSRRPGGVPGAGAQNEQGGGVHNGRKVWPWGGQQDGQQTRSHAPRLLTPKGVGG